MKKLTVLLLILLGFFVFPAISLAGTPPDLASSTYTNPGSSIPADGSTTGTITVTLHDSSNDPVVGDTISLSPNNGTVNFPQNNQTTDSNGYASFTITDTVAETDEISVNDNSNTANNSYFQNWFTVTFYSATAGCSNVPAAPVLNSVTSTTDNTATLSWTDSASPVNNYLVSYGIASGKYIYGDPDVGNQGTTTATIGSLTGGVKYYFVVSATNNCGSGGFSNEVSVVAAPVPVEATPVPTPEPTIASDVSVSDLNTPAPVEEPTELESPTPVPVESTGSSSFKDLAIVLLISGVVIIGLIVIVQKGKGKKNSNIPPMRPPMMGGNIPLQ